jgi:ABC-type nitrate/sulfonate/bicarbonate transport system substrate-binding protein
MRRRDVLGFTAGLSLAMATRCGGGSKTSGLRPLAVSLAERLTLASAYLAEESGYFRDAGFELDIVRFSNTQVIPLLAGGRVDVAFGGLPASFINAVANDQRTRIVAGREYVNPDCGEAFSLYARREVFGDGPIDAGKLRGKRFAVRSAGITEYVLDAFLDDSGMSREDVETVDLSVREAILALASGRIDAILDTEFARSAEAVSPQIVKVWRFADARPGYQYSFVLFGQRLLDDVEAGARFLAAYLKAGQDFLAGKTPRFMLDFAATHGLDVDETVSQCRDTFAVDGAIDEPSIRKTVAWHARHGRVPKPVEPSALCDTRFVTEANRLLADNRWRA